MSFVISIVISTLGSATLTGLKSTNPYSVINDEIDGTFMEGINKCM